MSIWPLDLLVMAEIGSLSQPIRRLSPRALGALSVWLLLFALLVPAPVAASPGNESDFVSRVNSTRASVGLPPLAVDGQLVGLARSWSTQMRNGTCGGGAFICHASPLSSGVSHNWAKLGENVGTGPTVGDVMAAFIASPGHYANIVDPEFTHIGVGVVWDGSRLYTTHRFMKLQTPAPTTTQAPPPTTAAPTTTTTRAPTTTTQSPRTTQTPTTQAPVPRLTVTPRSAPVLPAPSTPSPSRTTPTTAVPLQQAIIGGTPQPDEATSPVEPNAQLGGNAPASTDEDGLVDELTITERRARADVLFDALLELDAEGQ